jgi:hypothetical protein
VNGTSIVELVRALAKNPARQRGAQISSISGAVSSVDVFLLRITKNTAAASITTRAHFLQRVDFAQSLKAFKFNSCLG